jgi:hypothetical protein
MAAASAKAVITQAATAHGIDPAILWGVFGTETAYGADDKTSSAGAEGDLQLEPATARSLGVKNVNNLAEAANGAAKYLSEFKGRGVAAMLSAYNAGPAGGLQPGYVATTLKNAATYGSGAKITLPASTAGVGASTVGPSTVSLPGTPSHTERVTTANPRAAGFAQLEGLLRSEKGGDENPLVSLGILAKAGAPTTRTVTVPGTPGTQGSSGGGSATGVAGGEAGLPNPPASVSKLVPPPVKVTLPGTPKFPAIEQAKAALAAQEHHPVSTQALEHDLSSDPKGVQEALNAKYGKAPVVAEAPGGTVVAGEHGPVFVPKAPQVKRGNFFKLTGQQEAGAPLPAPPRR